MPELAESETSGSPPVDVVATKPSKSGSNLVTNAQIRSYADQWLEVRVVIRRHRRLLPDVEVASWTDRIQVEKGATFRHQLPGDCKSGKNQYFSKVTARNSSFSEPAEFQSDRAEISC
jgi:hypothetical protein